MTKVDTKKMVDEIMHSMEEMYVEIQNQTISKPIARLRVSAANAVLKVILLDLHQDIIRKSKKH